MSSKFVEPSQLRTQIVAQILAVFEETMPIYRRVMTVARDINAAAGESEAKRLGRIMHAAIRFAWRTSCGRSRTFSD